MISKKTISFLGVIVFLLTLSVFAANSWQQKEPSPAPSVRRQMAMAPLGDDKVLLFGGFINTVDLYDNQTWVYDLSDNAWTQKTVSGPPSPRDDHSMAYIGDDRVLLFGGWGPEGSDYFFDDTWVYDLSENTWTSRTPTILPPGTTAPTGRYGHTMAFLGGDQVLLFGGIDSGWNYIDDTWIYDLSDNTWTKQTPITSPPPLEFAAITSIGTGKVLLFGGESESDPSAETWVYYLSENTWTQLTLSLAPSARTHHAIASFGGNKALLFGGLNASGDLLGDTWIFDSNGDGSWSQQTLSSCPSAREYHKLASVATGSVLLFGGSVSEGSPNGETWIFGYVTTEQIQAKIDIMFCKSPNTFSCKKRGMLSVTIFGTAELDVDDIATSTLKLCLASNPGSCIDYIDVNNPDDRGAPTDAGISKCARGIANVDGEADLDVLFVARDVGTLIGCSGNGKKETASPTLIISGELNDGTPFFSTAVNNIGVDQLCVGSSDK